MLDFCFSGTEEDKLVFAAHAEQKIPIGYKVIRGKMYDRGSIGFCGLRVPDWANLMRMDPNFVCYFEFFDFLKAFLFFQPFRVPSEESGYLKIIELAEQDHHHRRAIREQRKNCGMPDFDMF